MMMISVTSHGYKSVRLDAHIDLAAETATYTVTDVDGHRYETSDFKGAAQTYKVLAKRSDEEYATTKYLGTTSKRTGEEYYVINSPRGLYFDIVPKSHPAQKAIRADRRDFTKPIWKEVAA